MFTAQASWLGSTGCDVGSSVGGSVLSVTSGSVVGEMGGLGLGLGPVLLPAERVSREKKGSEGHN